MKISCARQGVEVIVAMVANMKIADSDLCLFIEGMNLLTNMLIRNIAHKFIRSAAGGGDAQQPAAWGGGGLPASFHSADCRIPDAAALYARPVRLANAHHHKLGIIADKR